MPGDHNPSPVGQDPRQAEQASAPGHRKRSYQKILHAMNNYVVHHLKREGFQRDTWIALEKSLQRYVNGHNISAPALKARLWDYYVYEKFIHDDFADDINAFMLNSNLFFREDVIVGNISFLCGNYFGFKKSIFNPDAFVTQYFACIEDTIVSQSVIMIKEVHFNRSQTTKGDPPMREDWSGVMLLRNGSIFCILRDDELGTPRAFVLCAPPVNIPTITNTSVHLFGDEIECVEKWGKSPINTSPIILQKIVNGKSKEDLLLECDIIDKETTRQIHPHVWQHLYGGSK